MQSELNWGESPSQVNRTPWLSAIDPESWVVAEDWQGAVDAFWQGKTGKDLQQFLRKRLSEAAVIYPPEPLRALALTPLARVRVVILGQDPYHGPGQAEGLAFSVPHGVKPPPSLRNIFKEIRRDLGQLPPDNGSLVRWADEGVLLINTCLTVEDGLPGSHAGRGWEVLTDDIIRLCNGEGAAKAFLLWGAHAQKKVGLIDGARHRILMANHPSPLSASRPPAPFLGCGHFGSVNRWLTETGRTPIRW